MLDFGFYNMDCMDGMREFPDEFFDLAIVDPPYGGGAQTDEAKKIRGGGRLKTGIQGGVEDSEGCSTGIISAAPITYAATGGKWSARYRQRR